MLLEHSKHADLLSCKELDGMSQCKGKLAGYKHQLHIDRAAVTWRRQQLSPQELGLETRRWPTWTKGWRADWEPERCLHVWLYFRLKKKVKYCQWRQFLFHLPDHTTLIYHGTNKPLVTLLVPMELVKELHTVLKVRLLARHPHHSSIEEEKERTLQHTTIFHRRWLGCTCNPCKVS